MGNLSALRKQLTRVDNTKNVVNKCKNAKKSTGKSTISGNSTYEKIKSLCDLVKKRLGKYENDFICIRDYDTFKTYIDNAIQNGYISIDTETTGLDPICDKLVGVCLYTPNEKPAYIPVNHKSLVTGNRLSNQLTNEQIAEQLNRLLIANTKNIFFNAKFDIRVIKNQTGIDLPCYWDASIAAKVLKFNEEEQNLKYLWKKYCSPDKDAEHFTFDKMFEGYKFDIIPIDTAYLYAAKDAIMTWELYKFQEPYLTENGERSLQCGTNKLAYVFHNIESPIISLVADIEDNGVSLDKNYCNKLSRKYNGILQKQLNAFYLELENYKDKIIQWKGTHPQSKIQEPLNVGSPAQLAELFYDVLGLQPVSRKQPRGTGEDILLKLNHPLSKLILDYRGTAKLLSTYIDKMPEVANAKTGKVHCSFNSIGCDTSRFSCIAEDSMISMPGGDKKIQDVKPGDYVYGYDNNDKLVLKQVKNIFFNGKRECIRLDWISKYNHSLKGSLVCTPEHKIKTTKGWIAAEKLTSEHSIFYVHRAKRYNSMSVSGNNGQGNGEEHVWLKNYFFNEFERKCIHHIDQNRFNNDPSNLLICTFKEHINIHRNITKGYCGAYDFSYQELYKKCESVNWDIYKLPYDHEALTKWLKDNKINYIKKYSDSYNQRSATIRSNGKLFKYKSLPMVKDNLQYALELANFNLKEAASYFGQNSHKFINMCNKYEILDNHNIINITPLRGTYKVYDLEVEEIHNFIANELCVHNCSNPNLQNIPSHNKDIRKMFIASEGDVLIGGDFSKQEPVVTADLSGDKTFIDLLKSGKDPYAIIASIAFKQPYEECLEFRPDGTTNAEGKERRTRAKAIFLGICYSKSVPAIAEDLNVSQETAQKIFDDVMTNMPCLKNIMEESQKMAMEKGYVETKWGTRKYIPDMQLQPYEIKCIGSKNFDPFFDSEELGVINETDIKKQEIINQLSKVKFFKEKQRIKEKAEKEGFKIKDNTKLIEDARRQCLNGRVQGSAANQSKIALQLIKNNRRLQELGFKVLILVHDEIIGECPIENAKEVQQLFVQCMLDSGKELAAPVKVDSECSIRWYGKSIDLSKSQEEILEQYNKIKQYEENMEI